LAEASRVAEAACALTSKDIQNFEETRGTKRLSPGELLLEVEGKSIVLPFLNEKALSQLKDGVGYRAVRRELELCQFEQLKMAIPQATMEDLWHLVSQGELTLKRGGKEFLPEKTLDSAKLELPGRQSFQGEIPQEALAPAAESLVDDWGLRPSQAEAMVTAAACIYTWCAPLSSELKSGQMVWLAHGTKKSRRTDPALFQPVVLTFYGPNQRWVSDITYIYTREGWLYLSTIMDLYSRKIVGWAMEERLSQELVIKALKMAIERRKPGRGLLLHSDRGSQYASKAYQRLLWRYGMICSMSRKGDCLDNAVMESFFHTLKVELVYHCSFETRSQARRSIFEYVEVFYNRIRIHSAIGYNSPEEYENQWKVA